ncbi:MAG TPA: hypothetical protein VHF65_03375 [Nitrososphaera sp.]|nr:hypothetical protein [Nitrososphaera sp.]
MKIVQRNSGRHRNQDVLVGADRVSYYWIHEEDFEKGKFFTQRLPVSQAE